MKKVSAPEVVTTLEAPESPLPAQVQEALAELVRAAREGLLALCVGVGLGVVHHLMELEVGSARGHCRDRAIVAAFGSLAFVMDRRAVSTQRRERQV